jgi:hypothetical protein
MISNTEEISNVFEENPELAKVGTLQEYNYYLSTIFPDSKVKDIVYHGTKSEIKNYNGRPINTSGYYEDLTEEEKFDKNFKGSLKNRIEFKKGEYEGLQNHRFEEFKKKNHNRGGLDTFLGTGIYFTTSLKIVEGYNIAGKYSALINVQSVYTENKGYENSRGGKGSQDLIDKGYDTVTEKIGDGTEYNIFTPEQIHILGSKKDIKGFKKFMSQETISMDVTEIKTTFGTSIEDLGVSQEEWNSLSQEEQDKIKECN